MAVCNNENSIVSSSANWIINGVENTQLKVDIAVKLTDNARFVLANWLNILGIVPPWQAANIINPTANDVSNSKLKVILVKFEILFVVTLFTHLSLK